MERRYEVVYLRFVEKQLLKLPQYIKEHVRYWAYSIEKLGMNEVRKIPAYHDEPLKGVRAGQRSIRLTRSYRLIYQERENDEICIVMILEINKHEYKK